MESKACGRERWRVSESRTKARGERGERLDQRRPHQATPPNEGARGKAAQLSIRSEAARIGPCHRETRKPAPFLLLDRETLRTSLLAR